MQLLDDQGERHRFQVMAATGADPGQAIAAAVVGAGLGLWELARNRASLEDVFINLTTEEPAPEPAVLEPAAHE